MSLPHVILTVLSHRDATGYDITKEFTRSVGFFWKASHQQVYRELGKLADQAAVSCKLEPQDGKPDRKVYSITAAGKAALYQWFQQPTKQTTYRDELSAKLLTCAVFDTKPMIEHLNDMVDDVRSSLSQLRDIENTRYSNPAMLSREARLERLTLRRGIFNREAWLGWSQEVLEELHQMNQQETESNVFAVNHS
ncbi:transcriptional regulator [Veronia nyctiphanis]|uniref:Transcriptional regulator n=1 Tax=Veronia nyctiphanis TaxID=1278244 RepID=A0A4Q0YQW6_9GAMM|nr:PadR family transcriptional regulator [Veronia nyctiphanis]RXJ73466.1 transcriptional regulator [Veronia nyctiphanis]